MPTKRNLSLLNSKQEQAIPGRDEIMPTLNRHFVNSNPIAQPFPTSLEIAVFALGCFWGAERKFWSLPGVFSTAVGYIGGHTLNPHYDEVCTGLTDHAESVKIIYDPTETTYQYLLQIFWESHNPTQGMRQGNDIGSQYRSGIYTFNGQQQILATASKTHYQTQLLAAGYGTITTEILPAPMFYYA